MPLHTDYRPASFDEIVGNGALIDSLKKLLKDKNETPHTFLFYGPSGCGKTTIGRIVATELGAYDPEDNININYRELNTSDFRGIDSIREIHDAIHSIDAAKLQEIANEVFDPKQLSVLIYNGE